MPLENQGLIREFDNQFPVGTLNSFWAYTCTTLFCIKVLVTWWSKRKAYLCDWLIFGTHVYKIWIFTSWYLLYQKYFFINFQMFFVWWLHCLMYQLFSDEDFPECYAHIHHPSYWVCSHRSGSYHWTFAEQSGKWCCRVYFMVDLSSRCKCQSFPSGILYACNVATFVTE